MNTFLANRLSNCLAMFLRKFKNLPIQDFPSEPLRRFAFGVFPFHIFEPPRHRTKTQAAEKAACLFLPLPTKKLEHYRISFHFFNTILDQINLLTVPIYIDMVLYDLSS